MRSSAGAWARVPLLAAVVLVLVTSGAEPAVAQERRLIEGEVRDATTGLPLDGASVRVVGASTRVTTDAQGRYRLLVPAGAVELEATRIGYQTQRRPGGPEARVTFALPLAPVQMPEVAVVGQSRSQLARIAGSAAVVSQEELQRSQPASGNEVLRRVPGVHIQEEEGAGLRANIGIRGLNPDRSRTVLVLEDGVPVALNPYGEPEMYYTPPVDRMERLEVVKGSGSILFGPQTIGGVVNYVTPAPAAEPRGMLQLQGGTGEVLRVLGSYGGTWENVGAHVSGLRRQARDLNGLFFNLTDVTGKLAFDAGTGSRVGVKLSVYDEESNSTYVGLTEAMYAADPYQHPAPDDRLRVRRYSAALTHDWVTPFEGLLRTTAYAYTTVRNWQRQDYGYTSDGTGIAFAPTTGNRNRSFEVMGIEPRLQFGHGLGGVSSQVDAGLRLHYETAEDAHINGGSPTARTGTVRDFEVRSGRALSLYAQNQVQAGEHLRVTPGVRYERFRYERNILRTRVRRQNPATGQITRQPEDVDIRSGDDLAELIPGLGVSWVPSERLTVFAGAHRGFSPPRVKDALIYPEPAVPVGESAGELVSLQLDAERSWNLELGTRAAPAPGVVFEATAFLLDFSNQIVAPSLSAGSVAQASLANQGETRHAGVETAAQVDVGAILGRSFTLAAEVKHTFVRSRYSADRWMQNTGGDTVNVRGNHLPYAPEQLLAVGLRFSDPRGLSLQLDGTRVARQYTDNFETVTPSANGRNGLIPSYAVWDAAASYRLPGMGVALIASVKNVFDRTYIASRRPEGIRPGAPRLFQLGIRVGQ
jgi:Fe(3+) dicitrate transport protein